MSNKNIDLDIALNMLDDSFDIIEVYFDLEVEPEKALSSGMKLYGYKVPKQSTIDAGQFAFVPVNTDRGNSAVVRVARRVDAENYPALSERGYRWMIQELDFSFYNDLVDRDEKIKTVIKNKRRKKEREEMQEFLKEEYGEDIPLLGQVPTRNSGVVSEGTDTPDNVIDGDDNAVPGCGG